MFGSDILDVAIGMAFLFLFMSMIASALREAVEHFMKKRAVDLERGIKEMLRDAPKLASEERVSRQIFKDIASEFPLPLIGRTRSTNTPASEHVRNLYDHPLVSSLFRGTYGEAQYNKRCLPSYIPKESFSLALLDIVAGASKSGEQLSIDRLTKALEADKTPNSVKRVVLTALSTADGDLQKTRKSIEDWYDATMDRVSSWYGRRTALILFIIGLGAAVSLNVDSITIVKSLMTDKPLRQAIVAQAEAFAKQPDAAAKANGTGAGSFKELRAEFAQFGFPIGWTAQKDRLFPVPQACQPKVTAAPADKPQPVKYVCDPTNYRWTLLLAFMGWLITALAIMLGAPFWFDTLNKFISVRSSLKPPEEGGTKSGSKTGPKRTQTDQPASSNPTSGQAAGGSR